MLSLTVRGFVAFVCTLSVIAARPTTLVAQSGVDRDTTRACELCRPTLRKLFDLQLERPELTDITDAQVLRDSQGRIYYVSLADRSRILRFSSSGLQLDEISGPIDDPYRFQRITSIAITQSDTLVVVDAGNRRIIVLSPELALVRKATYHGNTFPGNALAFDDGRVVLNAEMAGPQSYGLALHVFRSRGGAPISFGSPARVYRQGKHHRLARALASVDGNGFWAIHLNEYIIERWDLDGTLLQTMDVQTDWFSPFADYESATRNRPPLNMIIGAAESPNGVLVVLALVPGQNWHRGLVEVGDGWRIVDWGDVYDSVIDIVVAATGERVGSLHSRLFVNRLIDDERVLVYERLDGGKPRLSVWGIVFQ